MITLQSVPFCFKELTRSDLDYYKVKKGNKVNDWNFDWRRPFVNGFKVFGLFVSGQLQGLIAVKENYDPDFLCLDLDIVESAPQNKKLIHGKTNNNRSYHEVGKTLIAFACWYSLKDSKTDGYVEFTSKSNKIPLYQSLGARGKGYNDMIFYPEDSLKMVATYLKGGVRFC